MSHVLGKIIKVRFVRGKGICQRLKYAVHKIAGPHFVLGS